jgi:phosphoribosylformylglycinamidine (FGAM) synthase-like enzyme
VKGGRGFELAASESQERVAMGTKEEVESRIREEEALGKL